MHLYIHIPYCIKKCLYCDFLSVPYDGEKVSLYVKSLLNDLKKSGTKSRNNNIPASIREREEKSRLIQESKIIKTIYLGGGTPGILESEDIRLIFDTIYENYIITPNPEITIEVNPCTVTPDKLEAYKKCGINRISMGVQSFDDKTLRTLGRAHDALTAVNAYEIIRRAGFDNVNLDLISCVPGDGGFETENFFSVYPTNDIYEKILIAKRMITEGKVQSFADSLRVLAFLAPEHISAYQLIIEEGTPFYNMYGRKKDDFDISLDYIGNNCKKLYNDDEQAEIYLKTSEILTESGYEHYEISNFAKPGYRSMHNCGYWNQDMYYGCGSGATGMFYYIDADKDIVFGGERYKKQEDIGKYIDAFAKLTDDNEVPELLKNKTKSQNEILNKEELESEHIMLAMRMRPGFSPKRFIEMFGGKDLKHGIDNETERKLQEYIKILEKYMPEYVTFDGKSYSFTEKGFLVSNTILSEII